MWLNQKDDLLAGREPRTTVDGFAVGDACDEFLHAKQQKVQSGELADSTWQSYQQTGKQVVRVLGRDRLVEDLRGADFDRLRSYFASKNKLVGLRNRINHTRIIFKYAYDAELIEKPVRFGANFRRLSAKNTRKHRASRMFEAEELRIMLKTQWSARHARRSSPPGSSFMTSLRPNFGLYTAILRCTAEQLISSGVKTSMTTRFT